VMTLFANFQGLATVSAPILGAALETLLTTGTGPGVSKRLGRAFALLTESATAARDQAYKRFRTAYGYRSDVVHGHSFSMTPAERLAKTDDLSDVLRVAWRGVIASSSALAAFDDADAVRERHLASLGSFLPPF
jgi:hypothetical protein